MTDVLSMMTDKYFISCDWGTSSFRLRLVKKDGLGIVAEETSGSGIAETFRAWQGTDLPREEFFTAVIDGHMEALSAKAGIRLDGMQVVLSGMASSAIGMVELPYRQLPFPLDGTGAGLHRFQRYLVISGVCSHNDVMRGEETKAVGCASMLPENGDQYLVMPGTHPKHIVVSNGRMTGFRTFMTGELFGLLSTESILSASVKTDGDPGFDACRPRFEEGARAGFAGNLLHGLFMVRTNQLLQNMDPVQNWYYLSGLMIGSELAAIPAEVPVFLVAGPAHATLYAMACDALGIAVEAVVDADEALIRGQFEMISDNR